MFSLQRLLGKDQRFFDLLEAGAEEARKSVKALVDLLQKPEQERSLDEFVIRRRQEKKISEEIAAEVCRTFVTPLEREDIEALSSALYKIPRTIEKFSERMLLSAQLLSGANFTVQTRLLTQTMDVLSTMVGQLRHNPNLEKIKEQNDRLQYFEQEADQLILMERTRGEYLQEGIGLRAMAQREADDGCTLAASRLIGESPPITALRSTLRRLAEEALLQVLNDDFPVEAPELIPHRQRHVAAVTGVADGDLFLRGQPQRVYPWESGINVEKTPTPVATQAPAAPAANPHTQAAFQNLTDQRLTDRVRAPGATQRPPARSCR